MFLIASYSHLRRSLVLELIGFKFTKYTNMKCSAKEPQKRRGTGMRHHVCSSVALASQADENRTGLFSDQQ